MYYLASNIPEAAAPAKTPSAEIAPTAEKPAPSRSSPLAEPHPWALGVTFGYFAPTQRIYGLEIDPYGVMAGLQFTRSFNGGLWFGARGEMFLGRTINYNIDRVFNWADSEGTVDSHLYSVSLSAGYNVDLRYLTLRYGIDLGLTVIDWDFTNLGAGDRPAYDTPSGSATGLHFTPGLGIYVPVSRFVVGLEGRYRVESNWQVPAGAGINLGLGWRF